MITRLQHTRNRERQTCNRGKQGRKAFLQADLLRTMSKNSIFFGTRKEREECVFELYQQRQKY
jgi:hypothetical protein